MSNYVDINTENFTGELHKVTVSTAPYAFASPFETTMSMLQFVAQHQSDILLDSDSALGQSLGLHSFSDCIDELCRDQGETELCMTAEAVADLADTGEFLVLTDSEWEANISGGSYSLAVKTFNTSDYEAVVEPRISLGQMG